MAPPSARRNNNTMLWIAAGAGAVLVLLGLLYLYSTSGSPAASPSSEPSLVAEHTPTTTQDLAAIHPPSATPLASPPSAPAGDGTTATIQTDLGSITFAIYNQSAPVASENFINLANAGFYNGTTFWRVAPNFVIQGGDPNGDGSGGPGYMIPDEPVVGNYTRGIVAMARTTDPNSAGSQFFIVLDDSVAQNLPKSGGYVIFGKVTSGLSVVDEIAAGPADSNERALDPTVMDLVTIQPAPSPSPGASPSASGTPTTTSAPSHEASPTSSGPPATPAASAL